MTTQQLISQHFLMLSALLTIPHISCAMLRTATNLRRSAGLATTHSVSSIATRLALRTAIPQQRNVRREFSSNTHHIHQEKVSLLTPEKEQRILDALWVTMTDYSELTEEDSKQRSEVIQQALDAGISIDARLYQNKIPLFHFIVSDIHSTLALTLIEQGIDIHAQDGSLGFTPLHVACLYGNKAVIEKLLALKVDVNAQSKVGATPIHCAASHGDPEIIRLLCENGASVKTKDKKERTPVHAIMHTIASLVRAPKTMAQLKKLNNALDAITTLTKAGVSINEPDEDGDTALHFAANIDELHCLRHLLALNAGINVANKQGRAPLHWACTNHVNISILLMEGAKVNAPDNKGFTPLHHAAAYGNEACVLALINGKADVHATNKDGVTPLHSAASKHNNQTIAALLKNGAPINAKTKHGITPFQSAIGDSEPISTLIAAGAILPDAQQWSTWSRMLIERAKKDQK